MWQGNIQYILYLSSHLNIYKYIYIYQDSLWVILWLYVVPEAFIIIFKNLYLNSLCCIRTDTAFFEISTGIRQGCILSPILFLVALDFVMKKATAYFGAGIPWAD